MNKALAEDNQSAAAELDIELHIAIVDTSHNATLIHMMSPIYELTRNGVSVTVTT